MVCKTHEGEELKMRWLGRRLYPKRIWRKATIWDLEKSRPQNYGQDKIREERFDGEKCRLEDGKTICTAKHSKQACDELEIRIRESCHHPPGIHKNYINLLLNQRLDNKNKRRQGSKKGLVKIARRQDYESEVIKILLVLKGNKNWRALIIS